MDKKIQNEIIKKLCELVEKCPDQRFGQILYNYYLEYVNDEQDPFYVNDKKSLEILKKCVDNLPNQCYNKDVIRKGEVKMGENISINTNFHLYDFVEGEDKEMYLDAYVNYSLFCISFDYTANKKYITNYWIKVEYNHLRELSY